MKRRIIPLFLVVAFFICGNVGVYACDETQSDTYVTQILFGSSAARYTTDENVKMLLNALYLCSEQSDNQGTDQLEYLEKQKVRGIPTLQSINLQSSDLLECTHNSWEYESATNQKAQKKRKKLLQNTVNKVFDFGLLDNLFNSDGGKCDNFAAMLYYSHILTDYLADDPDETDAVVNGQSVASYSGKSYVEINGNQPSFTSVEKKSTKSFAMYSSLDSYGRAGVAFANIGSDIMPPSGSQQKIGNIKPSGWSQNKYPGLVNSDSAYLYNRCHLIAHQLAGNDTEVNLITGTRYLNIEGMKSFEDEVAKYVSETGNHVLYRATPVYEGTNLVASGVQLEIYSVEDSGQGLCHNVYCYNVQPGVDINYYNGTNEIVDDVFDSEDVIPFAIDGASDANPDLIYEMDECMKIVFEDQTDSKIYTSMINKIKGIADEAREVGKDGETDAKAYIELKKYQYDYFEVLTTYVPLLLKKEDFFKSTF